MPTLSHLAATVDKAPAAARPQTAAMPQPRPTSLALLVCATPPPPPAAPADLAITPARAASPRSARFIPRPLAQTFPFQEFSSVGPAATVLTAAPAKL